MNRHVTGQAVNKRAVILPTYIKNPDYPRIRDKDAPMTAAHAHTVARFIAQAKGSINHRNTQPTRPNVFVLVHNGAPFVCMEFRLTKRRRVIDQLLFDSMKAAKLDVQTSKDVVYVWIPIEQAGYAAIALYPESECVPPAKEPAV